MKIKFTCPTSYTIGDNTYNFDDIVEGVRAEKLLRSFPYLFKQVQESSEPVEKVEKSDTKSVTKAIVEPDRVDMSRTKTDLQKIARSFNIKVRNKWTKRVLINKINFKLNI